MGIIISIVIGLFVFFIVRAILSDILKAFPSLKFILAIIAGLIIGVTQAWWAGIIVGLIALGMLGNLEEEGGDKCAHCGSYKTFRHEINQDFIDNLEYDQMTPDIWRIKKLIKCKKCGNFTYESPS